ncbi:hypothetical protein MRX96_057771 [Rhipicephalus microplus]
MTGGTARTESAAGRAGEAVAPGAAKHRGGEEPSGVLAGEYPRRVPQSMCLEACAPLQHSRPPNCRVTAALCGGRQHSHYGQKSRPQVLQFRVSVDTIRVAGDCPAVYLLLGSDRDALQL